MHLVRTTALLLSTLLALGACAPQFIGTWTFTWTVESATGFCASEVGQVSDGEVEVLAGEQPGAVAIEGIGDEGETLTGSFEGRLLTFGGVVSDDGGTTTSTTELTIADDGDSMSGTETWSWESETNPGACPSASSSIEAVREKA